MPADPLSTTFAALADPTRRAILARLASGERSVTELARTLKRLQEAHYPLQGASDHAVSEAIYLDDPDGNGIELYADRSPDSWPRDAQGKLKMGGRGLDMNDLLAELEREP